MGVSECTLTSLIHCGFLLLLIREACNLIIVLFERTFEKKTKKEDRTKGRRERKKREGNRTKERD